MIIALYKDKSHLFNAATSWWTKGPYSHCEIIFNDGQSASSSFRDGGVRFKPVQYNPENWDFIILPNLFNEDNARDWFIAHLHLGYDVLGLVGFVVGNVPDSKESWFCSESVLAALGYKETWRFSPNEIPAMLMADPIRGVDFDFTKYGVPRAITQ
jgi:hypothetical protein